MTIEERLTRLERKNRRLTLALASVGMAAMLAVAMGQGAPAVVPQEITAHKFTLVDGNGKTRADLIMLKDGPSLSLYDENGKTRAELVALKDGSGLSLYDKNDKKRAELVALKDGSGLSLYDKNDKKRARLRLDEDRPSLNLSDENGKPRAMLEEDKKWCQPHPMHREPNDDTDHYIGCGRDVASGHDWSAFRPQPGPRQLRLRPRSLR